MTIERRSNKAYVGIDNGVTGAVTILSDQGTVLKHFNTPVRTWLNYTKKKAFVTRLDFVKMKDELDTRYDLFVMIERPMINPRFRWKATYSAIRWMEAMELLFEQMRIPYQWMDSKEWQKALLPTGLKGDDLKKGADAVGKRLFPKLEIINSDSVLIAEYCRRTKR